MPTTCKQSNRQSSLSSGIILFTSISTTPRAMPVLQVSLYNMNPKGIDVVTGMNEYSLAKARFYIQLRDDRIVELFCDGCGNAGISPGVIRPYFVHLEPNQKWSSEIPLTQFLYLDSGDQRLDSALARRADLITSLPWSQTKNGDEQGTDQNNTRMNTATSTVTLPVFSRAEILKFKAAGAYSRSANQ